MNEQEAVCAVPDDCPVRTLVRMLSTVWLLTTPLFAVGAEEAFEGFARQYPEVAQRLAPCIREADAEYLGAREAILELGEAKLLIALEEEHLSTMQWNVRLVGRVIRLWTEDPGACNSFHKSFDACIRSSYGTQTGEPSERRITGCCVREWDKGSDPEVLMLERLFKYKDPRHVKEGIIAALGSKGSAESLSALRGLMNSTEEIHVRFHCVLAVGKLCHKLNDSAAVPDLLRLYKTTERASMEDVPEELKGKVPPPFQRQVVTALRHIQSPEALQALDALYETETDQVLMAFIDDAREAVRVRVKSEGE